MTIGLPNTVECLEAAIAAWKCGATPQPVSYRLPARERRAIIELAEPSLVVGVAPEDAAERGDSGWLRARARAVGRPAGARRCRLVEGPTSGGSTGRPKLIVSTQPALVASVEPFARCWAGRRRRAVIVHGCTTTRLLRHCRWYSAARRADVAFDGGICAGWFRSTPSTTCTRCRR